MPRFLLFFIKTKTATSAKRRSCCNLFRLDTRLRSAVCICSYVNPGVITFFDDYTEARLSAQECEHMRGETFSVRFGLADNFVVNNLWLKLEEKVGILGIVLRAFNVFTGKA